MYFCKLVSKATMKESQYFEQFDIEFVKLPVGKSECDMEITKAFFEKHTNEEIADAEVKVHLVFNKQETFMTFQLHVTGNVTIKCDICLEDLLLPIDIQEDFLLKQAVEDGIDGEDENVIYVSPNTFSYNLEQLLYELVYASIPLRKVHSDYPGQQCDEQMLELIKAHQNKKTEETNPQWDALKNLKL